MASDSKRRATTSVPTMMEGIPVLSRHEREDLIQSVKAAEADVTAGKTIDYKSNTFKKPVKEKKGKNYRTASAVVPITPAGSLDVGFRCSSYRRRL